MAQDQQSVAPAKQLVEANLFTIDGPIVISYSRSSIAGTPLFSYRDAQRDLNVDHSGITQTASPIGELVTVTIEHVPDAFVRTFTLLVPQIMLYTGDAVDFETLGIETTDRSGAFVPPPGPSGVLQTYQVHQLRAAAQHVLF